MTDTQAWILVIAVCVLAAVALLQWLGIGRR